MLFVPGLVLFVGLSQHHAEATSLLAIVPVAIVGTYRQDRYGNVRRARRAALGVLSVAGAAGGVALANALSGAVLRYAFAGLMVLVAVQLVHRTQDRRQVREKVVDWNGHGTRQSTAHSLPGGSPAARVRREAATGNGAVDRDRHARVQGLDQRRRRRSRRSTQSSRSSPRSRWRQPRSAAGGSTVAPPARRSRAGGRRPRSRLRAPGGARAGQAPVDAGAPGAALTRAGSARFRRLRIRSRVRA